MNHIWLRDCLYLYEDDVQCKSQIFYNSPQIKYCSLYTATIEYLSAQTSLFDGFGLYLGYLGHQSEI